MPTLNFDGVDDVITCPSGPAIANGAFTFAALIKHTVSGNTGVICNPYPSQWMVYFNVSDLIAMYKGGNVTGPVVTVGDWYIIVVSMTSTAGNWTPRFHIKNITTDAAWVHANASGVRSSLLPSSVGQLFRLGQGPGMASPLIGHYALAAWWDGAELNDTQVELLSANKKTSEWNTIPSYPASMLTELNTASPVDLKKAAVWTAVGNPALNGSDPPGWTFDGLGPVPIPNIRMLTKAGWVDLKVAYSRTTKIHTTASLAAGASEDSLLTVVPGWRAFKVATSRPARVRVYATAAQRTADAARAVGTNPTGNHGLLFELVTSTGLLEYILSPVVDFMADTGSNFYAAVTNLDSVAGTVATTYNYVRTE